MPARDPQNGHESGSVSQPKPGQQEGAATFGAFVRKPGARRVAAGVSGAGKSEAHVEGIEPAETLPEDAVEVGFIVDAYGLKGWVKVVPHAHGKSGGDALLAAKRWWLVKNRDRKSARCLQSKVHGDSIVARLSGCDDRDVALALKGHAVHIARSDFPKLDDEDEFYWVDLIGLDVENEAGVALGRVADMIDNGAHSILRVEYPATNKDGQPVTGERLIPFVGVYVKTVDRAAKRIVVDWDADY
ncbi:ribosome maturation factor RimM [Caballeronia sp. LZ062]|uniref:ribosome maturation factor RimM n=1 Tax=unclassified Caballeronia TaxID=2646786 RepID=UPI00285E1235|nr:MULTISPECIES: ribosome maturation factor RimM [unclassified Caballeronia]MDR5855072.1 ribosome maturation factor RimM [Caballeronia sp. LZ050]MDR5870398.1 ribosome maturation factor RimM [Caballeronia sp. LZ062]